MNQKHLLLAVLWLLFCVLHSVFASIWFKEAVAKRWSRQFSYYRLLYTIFALITFIGILIFQMSLKAVILFNPSLLVVVVGIVAGSTGLFIMIICIKKYFMNLSGLKSLITEKSEGNVLRIDGIHKYMRHPLYFGTFLFIWSLFLLIPHLSLLVSNFIITVYTLIAITFEERKLVMEFGDSYKRYKEKVPKIIPFIKRR